MPTFDEMSGTLDFTQMPPLMSSGTSDGGFSLSSAGTSTTYSGDTATWMDPFPFGLMDNIVWPSTESSNNADSMFDPMNWMMTGKDNQFKGDFPMYDAGASNQLDFSDCGPFYVPPKTSPVSGQIVPHATMDGLVSEPAAAVQPITVPSSQQISASRASLTLQDHSVESRTRPQWPYIRCNPGESFGEDRRPCGTVLEDMVALMGNAEAWDIWEVDDMAVDHRSASMSVIDPLASATRDRLLGATQMFLYRAIQNNRPGSASGRPNFEDLERPLITLPSSTILEGFIECYARRVDSYIGLTPSASIGVNEILHCGSIETGSLLLMLFVAHGALLTPQPQAQVFAAGLTEVCRLTLLDVLEKHGISDPIAGRCALLYLALCAWSSEKFYADLAVVQRGTFLSMLQTSSMLMAHEFSLDGAECRADPTKAWKSWRDYEWKTRQVYAWLHVDQEFSLFHDVLPMLSVNDIGISLPSSDVMWHVKSADKWVEAYAKEFRPGPEGSHTLRGLFKRFMQGHLQHSDDLPQKHLRLLLYPLQAMAAQPQQVLRCLGTSDKSSSNRIISRLSILRRVEEVRDLLRQWFELSERCASRSENFDDTAPCLTTTTNLVIFHLMCLNTFASVLEMERVARSQPPPLANQRSQMWRDLHYPDDEQSVLFHSGQIFRLLAQVPSNMRPSWWPLAVYRAAMYSWSLSMLAASGTTPGHFPKSVHNAGDQEMIVLNAPNTNHTITQRYLNHRIGIPAFQMKSGLRLPALSGNNALTVCLDVLDCSQASQLCRGVRERVQEMARRWQN